MKVLVTGGAGFIGSHVCGRLLAEGHDVWSVDDLNPFYEVRQKQENLATLVADTRGRFHALSTDITNAQLIEAAIIECQPDQIIHLAARAGVRPSLESPALYQRVNVEGTVNVLEAARKAGTAKVILASSSSVYGTNSTVPFRESDNTLNVISPYAASKLCCEALGHTYHHVYGMDVALLRFFTVYGPGQRPDLAIHKFAKLIIEGKPVPVFGDGSTARDYTYISDIVDGIFACTQRTIGCEIFNLGESQTVTLTEMIRLLEMSLGQKAKIEYLPAQPGDVPVTYADIGKARLQLGYNPKIKIELGIPLFVEWFLKMQHPK